MDTLKAHWITTLAALATVFLLFVGVTLVMQPEDGSEVTDRIGGVGVTIGGLALAAALWGLRTGRLTTRTAHTLVVVGAVGCAMFFWIFGIPLVVAITLIWAGVARGGLARELRRT